MLHVALINKSTVVPEAEVKTAAAALHQQVRHHFYPAWGIYAAVYYLPPTAKIPANYWPVYISDTSDVEGALGYHEFDSTGPVAKVFAKTCQEDNVSWTSCASHEILEMLVDSLGSLAALDDNTGIFYSYETCDAVESQSYYINGVELSNFVYPVWFASNAKGPYDFLKTCKKPFELEKGGYTETLDVSNTQGWQQITARSRARYHIKQDNKD